MSHRRRYKNEAYQNEYVRACNYINDNLNKEDWQRQSSFLLSLDKVKVDMIWDIAVIDMQELQANAV